jgi:aryl-alcohol dehydrogenase-like predicted oxidoreductase
MDYVKFGNTGMDVSKLCIGGMSFGDAGAGSHKWVINEEKTREMVKLALEQGINFFDTANIYANGTSELYLGKALKDFANRDEIVLATKVWGKMQDGPNGGGLSRKAIISEIDHSLKRLGTDYVDLYIIHRWDYNTPIEETLEALNDIVRMGKARYIGASAMYAWQFQKALYTSEKHGWSKFVSMQNHLNLIYREEEREMLPLCKQEKIAITPYSPLAGGKLTRDLSETTFRGDTDMVLKMKYDHSVDQDHTIIERVAELSDKYGVKRSQIALAWLLLKDGVTSPIIGATKESHLIEAVEALRIKLTPEDVTYLEETYVPHKVVGAQ